MQKYEINFIVNKKLTHQGRLDITKNIIQSILEYKGIVTGVNYLGILPTFLKKNIVEKNKYLMLDAYLNPLQVQNILRIMKQNDNIINYMIIKNQ